MTNNTRRQQRNQYPAQRLIVYLAAPSANSHFLVFNYLLSAHFVSNLRPPVVRHHLWNWSAVTWVRNSSAAEWNFALQLTDRVTLLRNPNQQSDKPTNRQTDKLWRSLQWTSKRSRHLWWHGARRATEQNIWFKTHKNPFAYCHETVAGI